MENWHDPDYEMIAALYAAEFPPAEMDDPDAAFLLAFASRTGGPVLDLGCGAGRFLVPLAEAGYTVTGVDTAAAMLAEAGAAVADAGLTEKVTLRQDDFRSLATLGDARCALAFCAQNTFLHMPDTTAQEVALRAIATHLRPGGLLVLDLIHPNPELLGAYYGAITHEATFASANGCRVDRFVSAFYRAATQTVEATWFYDITAPDRTLQRIVVPFTMRLIGRYEIELLLREAGFAIEAIYADTDLSPLDDGADRMIVVAVRGRN
ncbi:MAG: class I SAM-dependent methyltransferase [Thermomicrobiales bacterium]